MHSKSISQQAQVPYLWPDAAPAARLSTSEFDDRFLSAPLAESAATIRGDSRWPAFFPAPICLITAGRQDRTVLERVVGPMIVNRFPLIMAVSLCREHLSDRHYARHSTMAEIERSGAAAVQFLAPGAPLVAALDAIAEEADPRATDRLDASGLRTREMALTQTRVLEDAYLVYEGRLAEPGVSLEGHKIYEQPWIDVGSHRMYFLEVVAIHLKTPIARGDQQIAWKSLPLWQPGLTVDSPAYDAARLAQQAYVKTYTPDYRFPSAATAAFEADEIDGGMSIRHLPRLASDQVVVDNEKARWPCFFPSSAGMITAWQDDGTATVMPCGSSAIVARLPLTFAACISNSAINERYAPRATLQVVRSRQRLGVGVPYAHPQVVRAITYLGNVSSRVDREKVAHAGLTAIRNDGSPVIAELPIHFDCRVAAEVNLGTHVMVLAEVDHIHVRRDITHENPIQWQPWATLT